jgi:hypothetical protein
MMMSDLANVDNNVDFEFKLCFVRDAWAYFTSQSLEEQSGEGWWKPSYENNACLPYEYSEHHDFDKSPWIIVKVAYDGNFELPGNHELNSRYSINEINKGSVPWLSGIDETKREICIYAGVTLEVFNVLIRRGGGKVFVEADSSQL